MRTLAIPLLIRLGANDLAGGVSAGVLSCHLLATITLLDRMTGGGRMSTATRQWIGNVLRLGVEERKCHVRTLFIKVSRVATEGGVSTEEARDFITRCLGIEPVRRGNIVSVTDHCLLHFIKGLPRKYSSLMSKKNLTFDLWLSS
jgi:hypothetical protein